MKKLFKILILFFILLSLCSCKDKNNYEVIEISSYDLKNAIDSNKTNFVFAIVNRKFDNADVFLSDLQRVATRGKTNIYYVDYAHVSNDSANTFVFDIGYTSSKGQFYGIYENGSINNSSYYTDFNTMFQSLYNAKYTKSIDITSLEEQKDYISKSLEMYDNNKYNTATEYINHAWPNEEAKKLYKTKPYYQLTHIWESYEFIDKTYTKMNYRIFYFLSNNDDYCMFYQAKDQKYDGFKKPGMTDLSNRYYYIKDDIIYMTNKEDGSYEKYYKIVSISESDMKLEDLKSKKVLNFQRRE